MKKAAVFLMILTLSVSSAACGNKEKDDNQADAKTEQSQNADNSKDNDKSDTQTKEADNKMYELSSEDDVWTIKVSAPKGCSETDFSSDTARAFERIGNVDGSSLQYVMTLRNTDVSTVESDMKEEVQYLYTANSDDTIPAMDTQSSEYNGKMWNYFSYNMEELSGYRVWVELSDGDVFACTVEWIGEEETPDDIDTVIMKTKKHDTQWMVSVALMAAIVILLANTPLGMIQLPIIKATTVHIPVIIGAILLGPSAGAILGFVFGVCSLVSNTMAPTLLSFAFSPFMSTTGIPGAIKAIWISVGCRMLIGIAAGWLWILFNKLKVNQIIALPIVGFVGSMVNTITVMGSIYLLFAQQYAQAKDVAISAVWGLVMGTVTASGIPEAIAAAVLVLAIGKVLIQVLKRMNFSFIDAQTAK